MKHFSELAKLRQDEMPGMAELQQEVHRFALESMGNEDMLLDVPFSSEEVSAAVSKLKEGLYVVPVYKGSGKDPLWV